MTENRDGTFGPIRDAQEGLEDFTRQFHDFISGIPTQEPMAFHMGELAELEERKKQRKLEDRIAELEAKVAKAEPIESDILIIPSKEEMESLHLVTKPQR